jgi:biuret amidohydrolase
VRTAVLALHFQNDVVHPDGRLGAASANPELVENASRLLEGARAAGVPVVSVRIAFPPEGVRTNAPIFEAAVRSGAVVEGSWGAEFHERLAPRDGERVVTHARINGFHESDLDSVLQALRAERLVVGGAATHSSVEHTARHASDLGYEVVVAEDACSSADPELHAAAIRVVRPHVSRVSTVSEILAELDA